MNRAIEAQARRVAAAFGVEEWEPILRWGRRWAIVNGVYVKADIRGRDGIFPFGINNVSVATNEGDFGDVCLIQQRAQSTSFILSLSKRLLLNELMARGLYRLGFEDADVLARLPPLSMHEKLELRLLLAREFWPHQWLDEEDMVTKLLDSR